MIDKIKEFILINKTGLFIPVLFLIFILYISIVIKRKKFSTIPFLLTFISNVAFFGERIFFRGKQMFGFGIIYFIVGFAFISLILNLIVYFISVKSFNHKIKLIESTPSNIESNIYAYLNAKSKILMFTEQFYKNFKNLVSKNRLWSQAISRYVYEGQDINYKDFLHHLKNIEEKIFTLDITLTNNQTLHLELLKKKIILNGKLLGYVLINQKLTLPELYKESINKEFKKRLYIHYDLLEDTICYYDFEKKKYILTKSFSKLLGISETEINQAAYEKFILQEDLKIIQNRIVTTTTQKLYYRLQTINGVEWFEEHTVKYDNYQFMVIRRSDFSKSKISFKGYSDLLSEVRKLYGENHQFALIFISFDDIPKISETVGKDASDMVVIKYFTKLNEGNLYNKYKVYKLGKLEYCLIIDNLDVYEMILRDLKNNVSDLLGVEIYFNELKFELNNSVGLVSTKNVLEQSAEALIKAGFDALYLATDDKYAKSYSIYYPKKKQVDDYRIDLSDNFLDKYLK